MKTEIDFEKLCKDALGFEIVTDDFDQVALQKGLEYFESYEYWETMDGDGIYMKTPHRFNERTKRFHLDFSDFDPAYFICTDPSFFSDEIRDLIEYGDTIFACDDVIDSLEFDWEEIAESNDLIEEEEE